MKAKQILDLLEVSSGLPNINNVGNFKKGGTWVEPWDLDQKDGKDYWEGSEVEIIDRDKDGYLKIKVKV